MPLMQKISVAVTSGQGETQVYSYSGKGTVNHLKVPRGGYSGGNWLYPIEFEIDGVRSERLGDETKEKIAEYQSMFMSGIQFTESFKIFIFPAYTGTFLGEVLIIPKI